MNSNIKISAIVPVYNVEKYLCKCLDSLLKQTLTDIEIICINDGSTDNSLSILEKYRTLDNRILIINQENTGLSAARNRGLELSRGEYVSFIDSDDWICANFYEKLYQAAKDNAADIAVSEIIKGNNRYQQRLLNLRESEVSEDFEHKLDLCNVPDCCYVWNKIYNRASLLKTNIKFEEGRFYEDIIFTPQILFYMKKLVTVPEVHYFYYRHAGTILSCAGDKYRADAQYAKSQMYSFLLLKNIDISSRETKVKKYKLFGLTVYKTYTKNNNMKHILFNCIYWDTKVAFRGSSK